VVWGVGIDLVWFGLVVGVWIGLIWVAVSVGLNSDLWFWFVVVGFVTMVVRWWLWSQLVDLWAMVDFVFLSEIK